MISKLLNIFAAKSIRPPKTCKAVRFVYLRDPPTGDISQILKPRIVEFCTPDVAIEISKFIDSSLLNVEIKELKTFTSAQQADVARRVRATLPNDEAVRKFDTSTHVAIVSAEAAPNATLSVYLVLFACIALAEACNGVVVHPRGIASNASIQLSPHAFDGTPITAFQLAQPYSVSDGLGWITTVGMSDYGFPEFECTGFPPHLAPRLAKAINGIARKWLMTVPLGRDEPIALPETLTTSQFDVQAAKGEQAGDESPVYATIGLAFKPGHRNSDSFLTIKKPAGESRSFAVWLESVLDAIAGPGDPMAFIDADDRELTMAVDKAKSELPQVKARFHAGLPETTRLLVKCGFQTGSEHETEHMWVGVKSWTGGALSGELLSNPNFVKHLTYGQIVEVEEFLVGDWIIAHADGTMEGNYTAPVLMKQGGKRG